MNLNAHMREMLEKDGLNLRLRMPVKLKKIIDYGFISYEGRFFLKYFRPSKKNYNYFKKISGDEVGCEAFVNHIHMKDCGIHGSHLSYALCFVNKINECWNNCFSDLILKSSISREVGSIDGSPIIDPEDVIVRFYVKREGQEYTDDNLENYLYEAIMELESGDDLMASLRAIKINCD